jgi:hypothetical protein
LGTMESATTMTNNNNNKHTTITTTNDVCDTSTAVLTTPRELDWGEIEFTESNEDINEDKLSVFAEPDIHNLQLELASAEANFDLTEVHLVTQHINSHENGGRRKSVIIEKEKLNKYFTRAEWEIEKKQFVKDIMSIFAELFDARYAKLDARMDKRDAELDALRDKRNEQFDTHLNMMDKQVNMRSTMQNTMEDTSTRSAIKDDVIAIKQGATKDDVLDNSIDLPVTQVVEKTGCKQIIGAEKAYWTEEIDISQWTTHDHHTAGLVLIHNKDNLVLANILQSTPAARIDRWRSRCGGATVMEVEGRRVQSAKEINNILRNLKARHCTKCRITLAHMELESDLTIVNGFTSGIKIGDSNAWWKVHMTMKQQTITAKYMYYGVIGAMKLHDLTGWLKQQTIISVKYMHCRVIGTMMLHDLTGWLKQQSTVILSAFIQ